MKQRAFRIIFVTSLIGLSIVTYLIQFILFHDVRDMLFYLLQDLAFLPVQVLLVTLVLERLLGSVERRERLEKQNMVIGMFFSQFGTALLARLVRLDPAIEAERSGLVVEKTWSVERFGILAQRFSGYKSMLRAGKDELVDLKLMMGKERSFMLGLLGNQNLLEHESFTDLLWATFHLIEELSSRADFSTLPATDIDHLSGDTNRVYVLLIRQWISYMRHLKDHYPYLFSLAIRTNPFDRNASVEVTE
jgi:hypothetical protein